MNLLNLRTRKANPADCATPVRVHQRCNAITMALALLVGGSGMALLAPAGTAHAASLPEIRITPANRVPACVTPDRLMAFLRERNRNLLPKFSNIAAYYKEHGEAWRVRWDYAFFQMALETNYLTYRRGNGKWGDVSTRQNNFAGLGTTGGGVPGDSYPDVSTGVLAQIQHLVAYSGELMAKPVGPRTRLKQDVIVSLSLKLNRPVTFKDLTNRWAIDSRYHRSIEFIATSFRERYCANRAEAQPDTARQAPAEPPPRARASAPERQVAQLNVPEPRAARRPNMRLGGPPLPSEPLNARPCRIFAASYGGQKTVLIRSDHKDETHFTALTVLDGFEQSMTQSYLDINAPYGRPIQTFQTPKDALARAKELCPGAL